MNKVDYVCRAIIKAGFNPVEFNIYPRHLGKPVLLQRLPKGQNGKIIETAPAPLDLDTILIVHPDDGIKSVAREIKEKFTYPH